MTEQPRGSGVLGYVDVFDETIDRAIAFGRPGDWARGLSRLSRQRELVLTHDAERGRPPSWAYRLEGAIWCNVLLNNLLPSILAELLAALKAMNPEGDLGPWLPLHQEAHTQHVRRCQQRVARAEATVRGALGRYERKPHYARIDEGLRGLEELVRAWIDVDPAWSAETLRSGAKRLASALDEVLPPSARSLLCSKVARDFWDELDGELLEGLERSRWFWHHKIPGLGVWHPAWRQVTLSRGHPETPGTWFVSASQSVYESVQGREAEAAEVETDEKDTNGKVTQTDPPYVPTDPALHEPRDQVQVSTETRRQTEAPNPAGRSLSFGDIWNILWLEHHGIDLARLPNDGYFSSSNGRDQVADPTVTRDQLLEAWCDVRGITPKHLIAEDRDRVKSELSARFRVDKK